MRYRCNALRGAMMAFALVGCGRSDSSDKEAAIYEKDLGAIVVEGNGQSVSHIFEVHNSSRSESLRLKLIKRSCSCLAIAEEELVIPAGEMRPVKVSAQLRADSRESSWMVLYGTDTPPMRHVCLKMHAEAVPRFSTTPNVIPALIFKDQTIAVTEFDLEVNSSKDEPLGRVTIDGSGATVATSPLRGARGTSQMRSLLHCRVELPRPPEASWHLPSTERLENLHVRIDGSEVGSIKIPWEVETIIKASPSRIFVNGRSRNKPSGRFSVRVPSPYIVLSVESSSLHVTHKKTTSSEDNSKDYEYVCSLKDESADLNSSPKVAVSDAITIHTDHPKQPIVRIDVSVLR